MNVDGKTLGLLGAAILAPWIAQQATGVLRSAGVPIPVYVTQGQTAALAAFPSSVDGFSTTAVGDDTADVQSMQARWRIVNAALLAQNGAAQIDEYTNPSWNPTNIAKLTGQQSVDFANAMIAACDAGVASGGDEAYQLTTIADATLAAQWLASKGVNAVVPNTPLGDAYDALKGLIRFTPDDSDALDVAPAILSLALEMDNQGYLITGKPFIPTLSGGLEAAAAAVGSWGVSVAGDAAGAVIGGAASLLLSTPGLFCIVAVLVIGPSRIFDGIKSAAEAAA